MTELKESLVVDDYALRRMERSALANLTTRIELTLKEMLGARIMEVLIGNSIVSWMVTLGELEAAREEGGIVGVARTRYSLSATMDQVSGVSYRGSTVAVDIAPPPDSPPNPLTLIHRDEANRRKQRCVNCGGGDPNPDCPLCEGRGYYDS
jgi:hypothetical protein